MNDTTNDEIDFDLAMQEAGTVAQTTNAVLAAAWAPPDDVWDQVLEYVAEAMPLVRACGLCGLQAAKVSKWLKADPDARVRYEEHRARASARLLGVVWDAALHGGRDGSGDWKAAISLLARIDPTFNGQYKRQQAKSPQTNVQINAHTAQVIAGSSVEDLRKVLGHT